MLRRTEYYDLFRRHFSETLRDLCEKHGSYSKVCRELGINRQQFSKYVSGTNLPSIFVIQRLIVYFGVSPDVFFIGGAGRRRSGNRRIHEAMAPDLKGGFYLEYSKQIESEQPAVSISLWRFQKTPTTLICRAQIPVATRKGRKGTFDSYSGNVISCGQQFILKAVNADESSVYASVLSRQAFSPADLLSISVSAGGVSGYGLGGAATYFRFIGVEPDIAATLAGECGVFEVEALNARSKATWQAFARQVKHSSEGLYVA